MKANKVVALIAFGLATFVVWQAKAVNPIFLGDPFPNLTTAQLNQFDDGKEEFSAEETVAEGLGPVFNGRSCVECHNNPAAGGDSDVTETRFGTTTNQEFDPMSQFGGSLIQTKGIAGDPGANPACDVHGETVPAQATITAQRKTTPLFGLGLVDNVPDAVFIGVAALQKVITPSTAGRPNWVTNLATGRQAVGKFGWKSQNPTLFQFSGDAYVNEMGITSAMFPDENCPQGDCASLTTCDPIPGALEDDGSGVQAFANFMTFLAPPQRGPVNRQTLAGEVVFVKIGCANCHLPVLRTGSSSVAALDRVTLQPYSDFLLHDMGSLGDGIEQGQATGRDMRTAPLWGLRVRTTFLHDGRATTISDAIAAHEGQGSQARDRFKALSGGDVANLLAFLNSL